MPDTEMLLYSKNIKITITLLSTLMKKLLLCIKIQLKLLADRLDITLITLNYTKNINERRDINYRHKSLL